MAKILTDSKVKALTVDDGQRKDVFDPGEPGLHIRVSKKGQVVNRVWYLRYRLPNGRQPRYKLGTYPATSLDGAREKARAAKKLLEAGGDPAAIERRKNAEARAQTIRTFDDLAQAYLAACEAGTWTPRNKRKRPRTIAGERGVYVRHVKPRFGSEGLGEVTRAAVRRMVREMITAGIGAQTNQAHAFMRQAYAYAMAEELATENPALGVTGAPKKARERQLSDDELKAVWGALTAPAGLKRPDGTPVQIGRRTAVALQLTALLLQRRQEIAGMRRDELDLKASTWTIPGERSKGGRAHVVPLPPRALALIGEALKITDDETAKRKAAAPEGHKAKATPTPFVFPAARVAAAPMHPDTLTHAMSGLCAALELPPAAPHDFRRTGATRLGADGVAPFIVSQVLGHASDGGGGAAVTRAHYNRHSYLEEKRAALLRWEGLLLETVGERQRPENVTEFQSKSGGRRTRGSAA